MSKENMSWEDYLKKARQTNMERDAMDREGGFAPPNECGLPVLLDTAMRAIDAGGELKDWDCVAEGTAMLEDLYFRLLGHKFARVHLDPDSESSKRLKATIDKLLSYNRKDFLKKGGE